MKIKAVFLMFNLVTSVLSIPTLHAESAVQIQKSNQSVTLDMQNMTCAMCKITIKKSLQGVNGVQKVTVDYASKTAMVIFDSKKTNSQSLIKATTHAGYPATIRTFNN